MFDGSCCVFKNKANITSLLVIEEIAGLKCFYIDFNFKNLEVNLSLLPTL